MKINGSTLGEPGDWISNDWNPGPLVAPVSSQGYPMHLEWSCSGGGESGPDCTSSWVIDFPYLTAPPFATKADYQAQVKDPAKYLSWPLYNGLWRALLSQRVNTVIDPGSWTEGIQGRHIGYWGTPFTDPDVPKPGLWDFAEPNAPMGPFSNANPENGYSLIMLSDTIPGGWAFGFNAYTGEFTGMVSVHGSPGGFFRNLVSDLGPILPALLLVTGAGAAIGESLLGALGIEAGAATAAAVGNTALQTALNGGDVAKAVGNTVTGLVSGGAGAYVGEVVDSAAVGAAASAATAAAINGGNIDRAVLTSLANSGYQAATADAPPTFDFQPIQPTEQGATMDEITASLLSPDNSMSFTFEPWQTTGNGFDPQIFPALTDASAAGATGGQDQFIPVVSPGGGPWNQELPAPGAPVFGNDLTPSQYDPSLNRPDLWEAITNPGGAGAGGSASSPAAADSSPQLDDLLALQANDDITPEMQAAMDAANNVKYDVTAYTGGDGLVHGPDGSTVDPVTGEIRDPSGGVAVSKDKPVSWAEVIVTAASVYQKVTGKTITGASVPRTGTNAQGQKVTTMPDGTRIIANGNGTFTTVTASGQVKTTDRYGNPASASAGASTVSPAVWLGGAAVAALLLFR